MNWEITSSMRGMMIALTRVVAGEYEKWVDDEYF